MNRFLYIVLILLTLDTQCAHLDTRETLNRIEKAIHSLAKQIVLKYESRPDTTNDCPNGSNDACQTKFETECGYDFNVDQCSSCSSNEGIQWNKAFTIVRLPSGSTVGDTLQPKTAETKQSICYTIGIEDLLKDTYDELDVLGLHLIHFGSAEGMFRMYPAIAQDECGTYDPRLRSWFSNSSRGKQDMVIMIDTSNGMGDQLQNAINAAKTLINTLGQNDYFNVISFDSSSEILWSDTLVKATTKNREIVKDKLDELIANGLTIFNDPFETADQLFEDSELAGKSSNCSKTLILVSNGDGIADEVDELSSTINALNDKYDTHLFMFTVGDVDEADEEGAKLVSCCTGSVYQNVNINTTLVDAMNSYFYYYALSSGESLSNSSIWVEPYNLWTGNLLATTVATPVFFHDESNEYYKFLGVISADILIETLANETHYVEILNELTNRSNVCPEFAFPDSECFLQELRSFIDDASTCDDINSSYISDPTCRYNGSRECEFSFYDDNDVDEAVTDISDFWKNTDAVSTPFTSKLCCGTCDNSSASMDTDTIVIIAVSTGIFAGFVVVIWKGHTKRKNKPKLTFDLELRQRQSTVVRQGVLKYEMER